MKTQTSYKVASIALLAIFVTMITPSTAFSTSDSTALTMYGMADIIQRDGTGNVVFTQTVHNAITDEGEAYLLQQIFGPTPGGVATTIGTICTSDNVDGTRNSVAIDSIDFTTVSEVESLTVATRMFDTFGTSLNCLSADVVAGDADSEVSISRLVFNVGDASDDHLPIGADVSALMICTSTVSNAPSTDCTGTLFAAVSVSSSALSDQDTLTVSYDFALTTPTS